MTYTLKFSDFSKTQTVTVPDMPPGVNTIDTSLTLVGKNYPNYAEKIAENFLHLLENFSGPTPPENPIEGQLWYDTSDPTNKVLRVMDGTVSNTRWPSATGIYQQGSDPRVTASAGLKRGDIWVDTANNQVKIYGESSWVLVGPSSVSQETGAIPDQIEDTLGIMHWVIKNKVNDEVVSIAYNGPNAFTPRTVIDGFSVIRPGVTISSKNSGRLNSTALAALNLEIDGLRYSSDKFLRKNDSSNIGQLIEGKVTFLTPSNQTGAQGRDGLVINVSSFPVNEYIQIYKLANNAVFLNNKSGGKIVFKTYPASGTGLVDTLTLENRSVGINTTTNASSPTLNVFGNAQILNTLTILTTSSSSLVLNGGISIGKTALINENLLVSGITTASNGINLGTTSSSGVILSPNNHNTYDIGSTSKYFRHLYVSAISSTGTGTTVYGRIIGTATRLEYATEFKLEGQVTATSFLYAGSGTNAIFTASLTTSAIANQNVLSTTTSTLNMLVLDTSTSAVYTGLRRISKADFLKDVSFPGMIVMYGGTVAPAGWLLCNGGSYSTTLFPALFAVIGYSYGGSGSSFNVPSLSGTVRYIIKT
jgi:hypothetical protein